MKEDKPDIISFNVKAIWSIRNDPKATIGETYEDLIWHDDNDEAKPTKKEFDDAVAVCKSEWDAQEYSRNRKAEYDALNQLEMQFDDKEDGTTTWEDTIKAIKAKWPKDNSGPV